MQKIYKLSEASIDKLLRRVKDDFENIKNKYIDKKEEGFIVDNDDLKLLDGFYEISESINLKLDKDGKFDFENSKLIFEALKMLSPAEADDPRLWVYLTHFVFYDYTKFRWANNSMNAAVILDRFFYIGTGRGTRTKNSISRLWWTAYLTVRKNESDETKKWELTKAIFSNQDLQVSLLERRMGSSENVRTAFLEFYLANKSRMSGKVIQLLARDLNNSGGVSVLTLLPQEEIYQKLSELLDNYGN
jgi:hypothetical protein